MEGGACRDAACRLNASRLLRLASSEARSSANEERRDCVVDVRREPPPPDERPLSALRRAAARAAKPNSSSEPSSAAWKLRRSVAMRCSASACAPARARPRRERPSASPRPHSRWVCHHVRNAAQPWNPPNACEHIQQSRLRFAPEHVLAAPCSGGELLVLRDARPLDAARGASAAQKPRPPCPRASAPVPLCGGAPAYAESSERCAPRGSGSQEAGRGAGQNTERMLQPARTSNALRRACKRLTALC